MNDFWTKAKQALGNVWGWVKGLPVVKPLWQLVYSRKATIATAITGAVLELFPKLTPVAGEVTVVIAQLVTIGLVWAAVILGIAHEDAAAKGTAVLTGEVLAIADPES